MFIALISVVAIFFVLVVLNFYGRIQIERRDQLFIENNYFVGRSIEDVEAIIGPHSERYERWTERIDYVWGAENAAVLLISNEAGEVVDYRPARKDPNFVLTYFEQNKDAIVGKDIWSIKRSIGESHDYVSFDFGVECHTWNAGNGVNIEVWSKSEKCTDLVFNNE